MNPVFYGSHAYATMTALLTAYRNGENFISSEDYPFLNSVFATHGGYNNEYFGIHFSCSRTSKLVGYQITTDVEGHVLRREPIEKDVFNYSFDREKVAELIKCMKTWDKVQDMMENAAAMTKLATLIQGE